MSNYYDITSCVTLNDGNQYPRLGLGVYESEPGEETYNAVTYALEAGYRQIDGAHWYENEADCGRAIVDFVKRSGVLRSDIYYTTKLWKNSLDPQDCVKAIKKSLETSGTSIELYLVHDPTGGAAVRAAMWEGCCIAKDAGLVKSIGVSNFGVVHLQQLLATNPKYVPSVNQVDLHPFMTRLALVAYCESHGIVLEAWAPLVRGEKFNHPVLIELGQKYSKTPAQILVRYGIEKGFIVIPKSIKEERIVQNAHVFDFQLAESDVMRLDALDENLITDWDVSEIE